METLNWNSNKLKSNKMKAKPMPITRNMHDLKQTEFGKYSSNGLILRARADIHCSCEPAISFT